MRHNRFRWLIACVLILSIFSSFGFITANAASSLAIKWDMYMSGGQGVGFYDSSSAGKIEGVNPTGVCLREGEWVKYKISGLDKGKYLFSVKTSNTFTVYLNVSFDDKAVVEKAVVAPTGSYDKIIEQSVGSVDIAEDTFECTILNAGPMAFNLSELKFADPVVVAKKEQFDKKSRPYIMSYLPCIIQAENFDAGISGVAYNDMDKDNQGGKYRLASGVDIYEKQGGGYSVELVGGEWLKYTFNAEYTGNYNLLLNCSDKFEDSKIRLYIDGFEVVKKVGSPIPLMSMKEIKTASFLIKKGIHTLVVKCSEGDVNFDYLRFCITGEAGMDISNTVALRNWADSQNADDDSDDLKVTEVANEIQKEIYVSVDGNNQNDGSQSKPYQTIERAQQAVREMNSEMKGDIIVHLKGEFIIDKTLAFSTKDSGTNDFNVIYHGDGNTVINGGRKVTGWSRVEGTSLYKTKIEDNKGFRQFYINQNRGVRSRSKWFYWAIGEYKDPKQKKHLIRDVDGFVISGNDFPQAFSKVQGMEFVWLPSWKNIRMPVNNMFKNEEGNYVATFKQPYFDAAMLVPYPTVSIPFYIENAPEFLDEPGEWYFDKAAKELFYYPMETENMQTAECYIPKVETLLTVNGDGKEKKVENITFEGIRFEYGAWEEVSSKGFSTNQAEQMMDPDAKPTLGSFTVYPARLVPAQLQVTFGKNINFKDNEFAHLGSVALSYGKTCESSMVNGNIFDDISATAVTLSDWTFVKNSPNSDFCRKMKITNNLIRRVSVEYMTPAITAYYVNNVQISHNDILDAPYTGISIGWGWGSGVENCANNKIQNNKIENVLYKLKDGGHIYTLDTMKGSVISGNYMIKSSEWQGGIYHDNASAYITSKNNVFEDCLKWMKITYRNIHDNTAVDNYCERPNVVTYPAINHIQDAIGKTNGEWPKAAKEIIANAGLSENYKTLYARYADRANLRNAELSRLKYNKDAGIIVPAGDVMTGSEGTAYHEVLGNNLGLTLVNEPGIYTELNGTDHHYIMVTAQGEWTKYKVDIPEAGAYDVILNLSVVGAEIAASVYVDDKVVADKQHLDKNCDDYSKFSDYKVATVRLEKGIHEIKIEHAVGNFGFYQFRLVKPDDKANVRNDGFKPEIIAAIGKN